MYNEDKHNYIENILMNDHGKDVNAGNKFNKNMLSEQEQEHIRHRLGNTGISEMVYGEIPIEFSQLPIKSLIKVRAPEHYPIIRTSLSSMAQTMFLEVAKPSKSWADVIQEVSN